MRSGSHCHALQRSDRTAEEQLSGLPGLPAFPARYGHTICGPGLDRSRRRPGMGMQRCPPGCLNRPADSSRTPRLVEPISVLVSHAHTSGGPGSTSLACRCRSTVRIPEPYSPTVAPSRAPPLPRSPRTHANGLDGPRTSREPATS